MWFSFSFGIQLEEKLLVTSFKDQREYLQASHANKPAMPTFWWFTNETKYLIHRLYGGKTRTRTGNRTRDLLRVKEPS